MRTQHKIPFVFCTGGTLQGETGRITRHPIKQLYFHKAILVTKRPFSLQWRV